MYPSSTGRRSLWLALMRCPHPHPHPDSDPVIPQAPVKFRETEDMLLSLQDSFVDEVRHRQDDDLELESSISQMREEWSDDRVGGTKNEREALMDGLNDEVEERFNYVQEYVIRENERLDREWFYAEQVEKIEAESSKLDKQLEEEADTRLQA